MKTFFTSPLYWVVGTLLLAMLPQFASMSPLVVLVLLLPVAWRLAAERRKWKPFGLFYRVLITAFLTLVLVLHYGGVYGRRAAVGLLCVMLSAKLLETFRVRDERVVTCMAMFLCLTQFLFAQGLTMLFYGAACLVAGVVTLALLNRQESFGEAGLDPPTVSAWSDLAFGARLLALAVPFALVLFMFFPRWGSPLWGVPDEALDARTGLSDEMTPGSVQSLFMDDSPTFRVQFHGAVPPASQMYWRGPVLWDFDGLTWHTGYVGRNVPAERRPSVRDAPWHYTVQLEPNERHWLYALDYPAVRPDPVKHISLDFQLLTSKPVTQLTEYEMYSDPGFVDSPSLLSTIRLQSLKLPQGFNPRTVALMAQWRSETADDGELVRRVLAHFRREAFRYTLNPPLLTRDTVDEFLFGTRAGFCEHYASAFTFMMRAAGIPARVVTGYQGGWVSGLGDYFLVRQSDAHAWSEVWLQGRGWTRIDPTAAVAPSRVESNALEAMGVRRHLLDFEWLRAVRNGLDILDRNWNNWVIAFDATRQSRLFDPFGIESLGAQQLVLVLAGAIAVLCAVAIPVLLRLRQGRKQDRGARLWAEFRARLERAGVNAGPALGPIELARTAGAVLPLRRQAIEAVSRAYIDLRYAGAVQDTVALERALKAFRSGA